MCDSLGQSDKKTDVYQLTMLGQTVSFDRVVAVIGAIEMEVENLSEDEEIDFKIKKVSMYEHELKNLPEFEGY